MTESLTERAQHALEDAVYYFWVGVGVACGAVTVVRLLLPQPKRPARARL